MVYIKYILYLQSAIAILQKQNGLEFNDLSLPHTVSFEALDMSLWSIIENKTEKKKKKTNVTVVKNIFIPQNIENDVHKANSSIKLCSYTLNNTYGHKETCATYITARSSLQT